MSIRSQHWKKARLTFGQTARECERRDNEEDKDGENDKREDIM